MSTKQVTPAVLFCSLLFASGVIFGIYLAFFAREYTVEQVVKSRMKREQSTKIMQDNGWGK